MAQIRCGKLKAFNNSNAVKFEGRVSLQGRLDDVLQLRKHPRADSENDRAPAYEVFVSVPGKNPIPSGAAWLKNHANVGDFLSITMDKVDWPTALHLTAFPPDEEKGDTAGEWTVIWSRPRGARVSDDVPEALERDYANQSSD